MYKMLVKRGEHERFELLYRTFSETMPVVWERRQRQRRRQGQGQESAEERRQRDRRGPPQASWAALGFVVIQTGRFN